MRRDLKFKMQVRAVQLSMLLMNKNVKNLKKKTRFSFFYNLDVPIKVRASEFGILCSVFGFDRNLLRFLCFA